jgi:membrane-associated phospholipid phosphatase
MLPGMNLWTMLRQLFAATGAVVRDHRRALLGAVLGVALGVGFLLPHDRAWNRWIVSDRHQPWQGWARQLSFWGDYSTGTLLLCAVIWLAGTTCRRPQWRLVALATLLAASVAGLEAVTLRYGLGRARPSTNVADRLYGPSTDWRYASFPSGHAATSFGTAGVLLVAAPPVGIPVLLGAGGVVWSRLYTNVHYPSDVWAGACLGLLHGIVFAAAARRLLRPVIHS